MIVYLSILALKQTNSLLKISSVHKNQSSLSA